MEWQQATLGGLDETILALRGGFERLAFERGLNQIEGWRREVRGGWGWRSVR